MRVYIGFSKRENNLLSGAICAADGTPYSHVYMRVESKYGEYVYQASGLQVNFMNYGLFKQDNKVIEEYAFDISEDNRSELLKFFISYAGAKYQLSSLLKLLVVVLGRRVGLQPKFKDEGRDAFICSELGALFCEVILGIDVPGDLDFVTPKDLNVVVRQHGERVV